MKMTTVAFQEQKGKRPLVMVTAYDYPTARTAEEAGVDAVLVGDSLGMAVLGYDSTLPVTMEDMIHHSKAVRRGLSRALMVVDMPFMSYQVGVEDALRNAGRLVQEGGADAVKLEGGEPVVPQIRALVRSGIPVMGHLGLTPQSVHQLGGYKVQGRSPDAAARIVEDARRLEEAGCFSLVLECVPQSVAAEVRDAVSVPVIGIGAGVACDGQVLVIHDLLGWTYGKPPRFVKQYANFAEWAAQAVRTYAEEVREGRFPTVLHTYQDEKKETVS